jgi:hypothetical protein
VIERRLKLCDAREVHLGARRDRLCRSGGDVAALRLRLVATRNLPCSEFPYKDAEGKYLTEVILDFDYWAAIPKRG